VTKDLLCKLHLKRQLWKSRNERPTDYHQARQDVNAAIKTCMEKYKRKIEEHFHANDSKAAWSGLNYITGYKKKPLTPSLGNDAEWAEDLNAFYTRFEKDDADPIIGKSDEQIQLEEAEVQKVLKAINPNKAQGPDGVSPRLLKMYVCH
jgi:hypothetical protein